MKLVPQKCELIDDVDGMAMLKKIERCGRVCYKSEDRITDDSCVKFVQNLIRRGHESVLEHCSITVRLITDRAITHELVRHRVASFSQESQRYVSYDDVEFIMPVGIDKDYDLAMEAMYKAEDSYQTMRKMGLPPQLARCALPNMTKTEIIVTANLREWRHILKLRTSKAAHPQMRVLMIALLTEFKSKVPVVFDDIEVEV